MPRITISYRRDDSGVITGRIFDRLAGHYGRDAVFRDIDSIPPGADFREHISQVLDQSDLLLAIVGPKWLGARGGRSRMEDEADPVRVEIETGLRKGVPIIPVLVLRASMPRVSQLPESVKDFAYRQAVQIDAGQDFDFHAARLIRAMDRRLRQKEVSTPKGERDNSFESSAEPEPDPVPPGLSNPEPDKVETQSAVQVAADYRAPFVRGESAAAPAIPREVAPSPGPVLAPIAAQPAMRGRPGSWAMAAAAGVILGAVASGAVTLILRPPLPPDTAGLVKAKNAAEERAQALQAELDAEQKKAQSAEEHFDAAQRKLADEGKRFQDVQADAGQAQKDLAIQKQKVSEAEARIEQLTAQASALTTQRARADKAEKDLAAQTDVLAKTQAQLDRVNKDVAAQKEVAAKAQARADQITNSLTAQRDALAIAQAQLDQAKKDLAAQKDAAGKAKARADELQSRVKMLDQQLAAENTRQGAAEQAAHLQDQITASHGQHSTPAQSATAAPTAMPAAPVRDESTWTAEQRRETQNELILLGHLQGVADGNFGPATRTAIKQFQNFSGDPATGTLTEAERHTLSEMVRRLSAFLARGPISPKGASAAALKGGAQRYAGAWAAEKGGSGPPDPAEALYWYGLAAADGEARALTNLGTLFVRGQGVAKPDPAGAALLWWAAAARGEAVAMYDLGVLYEHGVGVSPDLAKAKTWYERAAAHNHPEARAALRRMGA